MVIDNRIASPMFCHISLVSLHIVSLTSFSLISWFKYSILLSNGFIRFYAQRKRRFSLKYQILMACKLSIGVTAISFFMLVMIVKICTSLWIDTMNLLEITCSPSLLPAGTSKVILIAGQLQQLAITLHRWSNRSSRDTIRKLFHLSNVENRPG